MGERWNADNCRCLLDILMKFIKYVDCWYCRGDVGCHLWGQTKCDKAVARKYVLATALFQCHLLKKIPDKIGNSLFSTSNSNFT